MPNKASKTRNRVLDLSFLNQLDIRSTWEDLTDAGSIVIPKNLYYKDKNGKSLPLYGKDINIGGFNGEPLIMRGDKITIQTGYKYQNEGRTITEMANIFEGYVSKVVGIMPIELRLEDNMFILKQKALKGKVFDNGSLDELLEYIVEGTGFTIKKIGTTNIGSFVVNNETSAQVLNRLQNDYGLQSYFRGNELRCGALIYIAEESNKEIFHFQKNIIEYDLEYRRKDDIKMSAIAYSTIETNVGTTHDGNTKKKKKRLSALITMNGDSYNVQDVSDGHAPDNDSGERRTFHFPSATTIKELGEMAYEKLKMYYYTGLKGTFTTFGMPFIKHGDIVEFVDDIRPEWSGKYKVKAVSYSFGMGGSRQVGELDFKVNG